MRRSIILLVLNLINYFLLISGHLFLGNKDWFESAIILIVNFVYTYKYYKKIEFYTKDKVEILYEKNYFYFDILINCFLMISIIITNVYGIDRLYVPVTIVNAVIFGVMYHNEIMVGKNYIFYRSEVYSRGLLQEILEEGKEIKNGWYGVTFEKVAKYFNLESDYVICRFKKNRKIKYLPINKSYISHLKLPR